MRELADAQHVELEAQKVVFLADKALAPLREAEAAAGAVLQRLTILAEQLEAEARRAEARRTELGERIRQIEQDAGRERGSVGESDEALEIGRRGARASSKRRPRASERRPSRRAPRAAEAAQAEVAAAEAAARSPPMPWRSSAPGAAPPNAASPRPARVARSGSNARSPKSPARPKASPRTLGADATLAERAARRSKPRSSRAGAAEPRRR